MDIHTVREQRFILVHALVLGWLALRRNSMAEGHGGRELLMVWWVGNGVKRGPKEETKLFQAMDPVTHPSEQTPPLDSMYKHS